MTRPTPTTAENLPVAATESAALPTTISPEHFEAIKAIGRIETAQFYATVAEKVIAETAIKMKEGRQYKGLPFRDANGNTRHVAVFDEYCEYFLGKSARRVQEIMSNYNLLGADLYEQAEQIGFRQRDYNALKALPADDQKIITAAIEDKEMERDRLLDLMQEMAAKHQREKEKAVNELAESKKNLEQQVKLVGIKEQKLNEVELQLVDLQNANKILAHVDWPEAYKGLHAQLDLSRRDLKYHLGMLDGIREAAMKSEPKTDAEEESLNKARETLAVEMVALMNECYTMFENLGLNFDKTLGAYSDARINLFNFSE